MRILLLTQKVPQTRGAGSNMRVGMHVEGLATFAQLHVVVASYEPSIRLSAVPTLLPTSSAEVDFFVMRNRRSRRFFDSTQAASGSLRLLNRLTSGPQELVGPSDDEMKAMLRAVGGKSFDVVMAFRLSMAAAALRACEILAESDRKPAAVLDLDDIDSLRMERTAAAGAVEAGRLWTWMSRMHARSVREAEQRMIDRFNVVYVCSEVDAAKVRVAHGAANVHVLPNVIRLPSPARIKPRRAGPPTIGFVGSMDYPPNVDGVRYFHRRILPRIRSEIGAQLRLLIVGRNPLKEVRQLDGRDGVEVVGNVADVSPFYEQFDLAVVPILSGGGTRIKILEAFAFERAVVSTSIGAEGIEAENGVSILLADDPDVFAQSCIDLLRSPERRAEIARAALRLVTEKYSASFSARTLKTSLEDLLSATHHTASRPTSIGMA
jgi:polysaccharide biosynthesis protein PslH